MHTKQKVSGGYEPPVWEQLFILQPVTDKLRMVKISSRPQSHTFVQTQRQGRVAQ